MIAVAIVGPVSGGRIELQRRRQRFLRAYREQAKAEFVCHVKAQILVGNFGHKGSYHPTLPEVASMWGLDAEERRLLEADEVDMRAMIREAVPSWKNLKMIPLPIDLNQTINAGGLGRLLRREAYHRRMRRKYQRAASHPRLSATSDPSPPE
jgi:hypothetical protein